MQLLTSNHMKLIEVNDKRSVREFIQLPVGLYSDNPYWIRPLDKDIHQVFDPKKNKSFRHGSCQRWLLEKNGKYIGRIAAFVNEKTARKDNEQPTGGVGFFECIDDQDAANYLFDTAKKWLEERGMEAMDGPINFGDRNAWWGLLVDGFDIEPNYQCNYQAPYYQKLFENYGFQVYFKQFTFGRKVLDPLAEVNFDKAQNILDDPRYSFRHMKMKKSDEYAEYFRTVYNAAWAGHSGVAAMNSAQAKNVMKQLKPIMDEKVIMFGFFDDKPIAFFVNIPEMNQIFKRLNGKLDLPGKLKFVLYHKILKVNRKLMGLVFGIDPEHHGKGVDAAIILAFRKMVQDDYKQYDDFEMNWIGDFNPKMINVAKRVGGKVIKTHHTYRYLFDPNKEFKRMPIKG